MKTIITFFLISLHFFTTVDAQISTETNIGSKRLDITLDMTHHPDSKKRFTIYTHNLVGFHHKSEATSLFTFNKLSYTFKPGIGVSVNLVGNFRKFYPSAGVHYDKKLNKFSLFILTTYAFNYAAYNENFIILTYKYPFTKKLNLFSQGEFYTSLRKWAHDVSLERIKLGVEIRKTRIGLFYESVQNGGKFNSINIGGSIKQTF